MTLQEQLVSVQRAIARIEEGGQEIDIEVSQHRRNVVRAKLKDLYPQVVGWGGLPRPDSHKGTDNDIFISILFIQKSSASESSLPNRWGC